MDAIKRIVMGTRGDLELSNRWWHRLAKVLLVLSTTALAMISWKASDYSFAPRPRVGNITLINLEEYRHQQSKATEDIIGHFIALPGTLGAC